MKIKSFFSQYLPVIISAIILTVCLAYAWAPPASPPPSGNVSVPINTGSEDQSKLGGFGLGGGIGQAIQWLKNIGGTLKIIDEEGIASLEIGQDNVVSIKDSGNDGKLRIGDSAGANAEICLNDQCFKKADLLAGGGNGGSYSDTWNYLYVYLTTQPFNGDLGGLAGANSKCETYRPSTVPSGLTYKAYLCDSTTCQIPPVPPNTIVIAAGDDSALKEYKIVNLLPPPSTKTPMNNSDTWNILQNGLSGLVYGGGPLSLKDMGLQPAEFWSGTTSGCYNLPDGTSVCDLTFGDPYNCNDWTNSSFANGRVGRTQDSFTSYWTGVGTLYRKCSNQRFLLCVAYSY